MSAQPEPLRQRRAVALISGGLDSLLAAKVVQAQGVHIEGINFYTGFCAEGHSHAIRERDGDKPKRNNALWVAEQLGIKLHIIDIAQEYKDIVLNPRYGYGQHLNPCLDCKIFMVGRAQAWCEAHGFDFIVTGEVIGQRPKSQKKNALPLIARESGAQDRLLRPLCAKNLLETLPERMGWVKRDELFGFHGRNRKPQIELAAHYGLTDFAQPAGGCCFLSNEQYAAKLSDLWQSRGVRDYTLDDVLLLKIGRHVRPAPHFKMVISREPGEAFYLEGYRQSFITLRCLSHAGPFALIDGSPTAADLELAARLLARYSQGRDADCVTIGIERPGRPGEVQAVAPLLPEAVPKAWHV